MQNFFKTIYFDLSLLRALPFSTWTKMTFSKYKCLLLILLGAKSATLRLDKQKIEVSTIGDLGTTISSISDEYAHLYRVVDEEIKTVVDIGANIGQFTNAIKYWYPNSRVFSFEADPHVYKTLVKNTNLKDIFTYNKALSDSRGIFKFYRAPFSVMSSLIKTSEDQEYIEVETETADSVLRELNCIDLLKIDVEGAELKVLRGAHDTLRKSKYLLIEISFNRNTESITNMDVLNEIRLTSKDASIIHTGRPLGWGAITSAQDFLIKLNNK